MKGIILTLYIILGFIQLFAIHDGIMVWLQFPSFLAYILAFLLTYFPVIGSVVGIFAVLTVWHWPLWKTLLVFIWPLILFFVGGLYANIRSLFDSLRRY